MLVKSKVHFWGYAILGLALIQVFGTFCNTWLVPARWHPTNLGMLIPIAFCAAVAVAPRNMIGWGSRAFFGFLQAVGLLFVFSDFYAREIRVGDAYVALREWIILSLVYSTVFAAVTEPLARVLARRCSRSRHICEHCEYNLTGLTLPRCPECGTKFDPVLLTELGNSSKPAEPS